MSEIEIAARASSRGRWRRNALKCALFLGATALLLEIALHALVLGDTQFLPQLRSARLYADRWNDSFYFQLEQHLIQQPGSLSPKMAHARLGWTDETFDRESLAHKDEDDLAGRRPILLFGDSYTKCMSDEANCFEGLMQGTDWAATHRIYNYGVRGYGIDQIAMLVRATLPRWQALNPLVVIGIYADDDLDRATLDFRGWPKPRFELDGEGKLIEPELLPSAQQYERENPMWRHSLAWGWLVHGSDWLPDWLQVLLSGRERREEQTRKLCGAILARLEHDLALAGVQRFYVIFQGPEGADTLEPHDWREQFLLHWLDARDLPYISMRRELLRGSIEEMRAPGEYFGRGGLLAGHLTPDGNRIAFRGFERGLRGEFDRVGWPPPPHPSELRPIEGRMRKQFGTSSSFPDWADSERILFAPLPDQSARMGCQLSTPARRFVTSARLLGSVAPEPTGPAHLELLVDDVLVFAKTFERPEVVEHIELDLFTHTHIEIRVSAAADSPAATLMLSKPRFQ